MVCTLLIDSHKSQSSGIVGYDSESQILQHHSAAGNYNYMHMLASTILIDSQKACSYKSRLGGLIGYGRDREREREIDREIEREI